MYARIVSYKHTLQEPVVEVVVVLVLPANDI